MTTKPPSWDTATALINVCRQLESQYSDVLVLTDRAIHGDTGSHTLGVVVPDASSVATLDSASIVLPARSQAVRTAFNGGFYISVEGRVLLTVVACLLRPEYGCVRSKEVDIIGAMFDVPECDCVVLPEGISRLALCLQGIPKSLLFQPKEKPDMVK